MKINIQKYSKYLSLILVLVVLVCFLSIPAFAANSLSSDNTSGFHILPKLSTRPTNAQLKASGASFNFGTGTIYLAARFDNVYFAWMGNGGNFSVLVPTDTYNQVESSSASVFWYCFDSSTDTSYSTTINQSGLSYVNSTSNTFYTYNTSVGSSGASPVDNYYATQSDLYSAFSLLLSGPPLNAPSPVEFPLNPGYCAFLDISDLTNVEVSLFTTLFGGADWNNHTTDQAIGSVSSLPTSFSLPIAGTSSISWSGSGSKNILGQYKSFSASYTYTSVGRRYLVIVNPLQSRQGGQLTAMASMPSARNNPISVSITQARDCKIYSMTSSLDIGSGTLDIDSNGDTNTGIPDENGNWQWVNDQTGEPIDPGNLPIGGGNDPIIGQETSINDWLQDIANQIKGFFSGAIGAVSTLVGAGSAFIGQLISLYSWLPAPVYSVLSAALILVITIGVIKVFI